MGLPQRIFREGAMKSQKPMWMLMVLGLGCGTSHTVLDSGPRVLKMTLQGEGQKLRLAGSPHDPDYRATYPNPKGLTGMQIQISDTGRIESRCTVGGKATKCSDLPVIVEVERRGKSDVLQVMDLYGETLAEMPIVARTPTCLADGGYLPEGGADPSGTGSYGGGGGPIAEGSQQAPSGSTTPAGSGSGCGGIDDDSSCYGPWMAEGVGQLTSSLEEQAVDSCNPRPTVCIPGGGTGTGTGGQPGGGLSADGGMYCVNGVCVSLPSGPPGGGETLGDGGISLPPNQPAVTCTALGPTEKTRYCAIVNQKLQSFNISYTLDCAVLDKASETLVTVPSQTFNSTVGCNSSIAGPAMEEFLQEWTKTHAACMDPISDLLSWKNKVYMHLVSKGVCGMSPLVLDLNGDGMHFTTPAQGVAFDLLADGQLLQSAWLAPKDPDAFLVLDRNGNGRIDDGSELFGHSTGHARFEDGFAALRTLDENGDGRVDAKDPDFRKLRLWNGHEANAGRTLKGAGIVALETLPTHVSGAAAYDDNGNNLPLQARYERKDGSKGLLVDAFLRFEPRATVPVCKASN
jgi:hypothetical protein